MLDNQTIPPPQASPTPQVKVGWKPLAALAATALLAWMALFPSIFGAKINRQLGHWIVRGMGNLRSIQSGRVGDYIAWLVLGIAVYGILLVLLRRST